LTKPYSFVPPLVGVWMIVGATIGLVLWFTQREKVRSVREAMGEAEEPATSAATA